MEYSSGYFLGYPIVVVEGKPKVVTDIWPFSPQLINADAAIEEYKYLTTLNPEFKQRSKWIFGKWPEPDLRSVYITIGRMLNKLKRYDEVIIYLKEGVKEVPGDLVIEGELQLAYGNRAETKVKKGDYDGAIEDLKSSIAIKGDRSIDYRDYQTLAEIYIKKGMKKEALEAFSKVLEIVRKEKWSKERENELETKIEELQKQ